MVLSTFGVRATAGTHRLREGLALDHSWTPGGVVSTPAVNGAQLLHLSVAMCVLNDTYREAQRLAVPLDGVAVEADGGFDEEWRSTGIRYSVELDTPAGPEDRARLLDAVDLVAEIPRAIRAGTAVSRSE